jgi:hypothetical protein
MSRQRLPDRRCARLRLLCRGGLPQLEVLHSTPEARAPRVIRHGRERSPKHEARERLPRRPDRSRPVRARSPRRALSGAGPRRQARRGRSDRRLAMLGDHPSRIASPTPKPRTAKGASSRTTGGAPTAGAGVRARRVRARHQRSASDCPAELMPPWLAELVPVLDDGIAEADVPWFMGELLTRREGLEHPRRCRVGAHPHRLHDRPRPPGARQRGAGPAGPEAGLLAADRRRGRARRGGARKGDPEELKAAEAAAWAAARAAAWAAAEAAARAAAA